MGNCAPAVLVREGFPPLMSQDRAPGRHLSEVTRSICMGMGDFDDDADPPWQLMQLGLTMEWGLASQIMHHYPGRYLRAWDERHQCWKTGMQVERDGITGNIDLLNIGGALPWEPAVPGAAWAVEDAKMTRKSASHPHDNVNCNMYTGEESVSWAPKWREAWMRVAGYCWMIGARVGRLWVAHLFDYRARGGGDTWCGVWERRWDNADGERELAGNWEVIVRHERTMLPCKL